MSFSVSANQYINIIKSSYIAPETQTIKSSTVKVDNNLLYLYNNNVFKNDTFKFNITLNDSWTKPTYDQAHEFAFNTTKPQMMFTSNDNYNPNNTLSLTVGFEKLTPEAKSLKLDTLVEMLKSELPNVEPKTTNFDTTKSSTVSNTPFRYFTFDLSTTNGVIKSYMYIGTKNDSVYIFTIANVNNANKLIVSKALKSIVLQ